jgi:hypothetical protein
MDLRAKLARLRSMEPPAALFEPPPWAATEPAPDKSERISQLRALISEVALRDRKRMPANAVPAPAAAPPPWLLETTAHGPLHVCTRYLEPDAVSGARPSSRSCARARWAVCGAGYVAVAGL